MQQSTRRKSNWKYTWFVLYDLISSMSSYEYAVISNHIFVDAVHETRPMWIDWMSVRVCTRDMHMKLNPVAWF